MSGGSNLKISLLYVVEDTDRHGNVRLYYRRRGFSKVRLPGPIGSPQFLAAYKAAENRTPEEADKKQRVTPGSMRALCVSYFDSAVFKKLDPATQTVRRGILERFCQKNGDGDKPYALMLPRHIRQRRDEMMDRPGAANNLVKALRALFKFATSYDLHDSNPAATVEYFGTDSEGFHSWTLEEIQQYEDKHPIGSTARLALALALYTGQRRSDIVLFGRQHVKDGWLVFTQQKNRKKKPVRLEIPMVPELQKIIAATNTGDLTFLKNGLGRAFTVAGFGNRFREWCDRAGLHHCSVHGLRKATAARLAELGCTEFEIMAITGHCTSKEVTRYTRAASQKTRAASAVRKMTGEQS